MIRFYRSTSRYPAYDHTSFNVEMRTGEFTGCASLHVKHSWAGGGWWFGLRPEIEMHYATDRARKLRAEFRGASVEATCAKCGKKEWGPPGMGLPEDWEYGGGAFFKWCADCVKTHTYAELLDSR